MLRHADGVPPAAAAGERLQGACQLPASPEQQAGLLCLLLLYQVLGVGAAQGLGGERPKTRLSQRLDFGITQQIGLSVCVCEPCSEDCLLGRAAELR